MNPDPPLSRAVWRGGKTLSAICEGISTGSKELDTLLPGHGWPRGALTEILCRRDVSGGLHLVIPALARLSQSDRWLVWVAPPYIPYAPTLASMGINLSRMLLIHARSNRDNLWTLEQALRSSSGGAALAWLDGVEQRILRRLQLAAEVGHSWGILFRPPRAASQPSPAAVRLKLEPAAGGIAVHVLKRWGGWPIGPVSLDIRRQAAESSLSSCVNKSKTPSL